MIELTLQFPSLPEMVDFQAHVDIFFLCANHIDLTLTAEFTEADIELAKAAYGAVVIQNTNG